MKLVFNLIQIKSGGGQKVASNYLKSLTENNFYGNQLIFVVLKNTIVHQLLVTNKVPNDQIIVVSNSPLKRLYFELFASKRYLIKNEIDIIYTLFGYSLFSRKIKQVSGIAVSNIFFPEINFWKDYNGVTLLKKKLIDLYRKKTMLKADGLIFENSAMQKKCNSLFYYPSERTIFSKPSVSFDSDSDKNLESINERCNNLPDGYKVLLLSGWHRNKNILSIPEIAQHLKQKNVKINFILTLNPLGLDFKLFMEKVKKYNVYDYITFFKPVQPYELKSLYNAIDSLLLISNLESFSNNLIEAWYYRKPLIITDAEWSRSICNKAALYVKNTDPDNIANNIIELAKNINLSAKIIAEGTKEFKTYPTIKEKIKFEFSFLERIKNESTV